MTSQPIDRSVNRLADLRQLYEAETGQLPDATAAFDAAFTSSLTIAQASPFEDATSAELPDPEAAQLATEVIVRTIFDLCNGTRLETWAESLAFGIVNSFQRLTETLDKRCEDAARRVKELASDPDGSEIQSVELEEAMRFAQSLQEAQDAIAVMRDHAAQCFAAETGRVWHAGRASMVSSKMTAAVIQARDFERARRDRRIANHAPAGSIVVFSGGQQWDDFDTLYTTLAGIKARFPDMLLATTAQAKGADAIASAWAAANKVKVIAYVPNKAHGNAAGFRRNDRMVRLSPVEAIVCEGSGIQQHLARELLRAKVPCHLFRNRQKPAQPKAAAG